MHRHVIVIDRENKWGGNKGSSKEKNPFNGYLVMALDRWMKGRMDGQMDRHGQNNIPPPSAEDNFYLFDNRFDFIGAFIYRLLTKYYYSNIRRYLI